MIIIITLFRIHLYILSCSRWYKIKERISKLMMHAKKIEAIAEY
jgi:hypothetical protein